MTELAATPMPNRFAQFYALTKPKVVQLIVFCALIGMVLAVPGVPTGAELLRMAVACAGIWLVAGAAAAFNCLVEQSIDARMKRTAWRPTARGELSNLQTLMFSAALCIAGSAILIVWINAITMWLTFATFVGYAIIYTVILKPLTPQNIVIGGASGAMPPVLGWAAMTGDVSPQALLLFLIIFLWTPPHSWALALYSAGDYAKAGIPMMPVARGAKSTRLQILIYTLIFVPIAVAPTFVGVGGVIYGVVSITGGLFFLYLALRLWRSRAGDQPDKAEAVGREAALYDVRAEAKPARNLFAFSILYLMALFSALLVEQLPVIGV